MSMHETRNKGGLNPAGGLSEIWVGVDIGGTKTLCVALSDDGEILATVRRPTARGNERVIGGTIDIVQTVLDRVSGRLGRSPKLRGVGVGVPGTVDGETGHVEHAINLDVDDIDLGAAMMGRFDTRISVENDVNAAALGVYRMNDHAAKNFVFLSMGTGVAAGVVVGGQLMKGASGVAGEIGHIVVKPDGDLCGCGQRGCLETVISGTALSRAWPIAHGYSATDLLDKVTLGDVHAEEVWHEFGMGLAMAVQILTLTLDPTDIVLGGGISRIGRPLLECAYASIASLEQQSPFLASLRMRDRLRLVDLQSPVGAIGAAFLPQCDLDGPGTGRQSGKEGRCPNCQRSG